MEHLKKCESLRVRRKDTGLRQRSVTRGTPDRRRHRTAAFELSWWVTPGQLGSLSFLPSGTLAAVILEDQVAYCSFRLSLFHLIFHSIHSSAFPRVTEGLSQPLSFMSSS